MRLAALLLALLLVPTAAAHVPQAACEPNCAFPDPTFCATTPGCFLVSVAEYAGPLVDFVLLGLPGNVAFLATHCAEHAQAGEACDGTPLVQSP